MYVARRAQPFAISPYALRDAMRNLRTQHAKVELSLRKLFNIIYPDGSRVKVDFADKEQMLLAGELRATSNPSVYAFAGEVCRMRSFSSLGAILTRLQDHTPRRRYLGLRLTFELGDKRYSENEMTPEGMALQLRARGLIARSA